METKFSIGRVHKVYPNKLIVEVPDTEGIHYVHKGEFFQTKGINSFITIYNSLNEKFVFQIVGLYEQEKPIIKDESSKLESFAYFESIPIGEIKNNEFEYGLLSYPMIGDKVFVTSSGDLDIVMNKNAELSIQLGFLENQDNYYPRISVDDLFTHHMSILGNTNSGKSTTARKIIQKVSKQNNIDFSKLNFIIFDIHDEYGFIDNDDIMKSVDIDSVAISLKDLTIEDWINLVRPSDRVQLPILKQAIRLSYLIREKPVFREAIKVYCAVATFKNQSSEGVVKRNTVINLLEDVELFEEMGLDISKEFNWRYANIDDDDRREFLYKVDEYLLNILEISYREFYNELQNELSNCLESVNSFDDLLEAMDYLFIMEESHGNKNIRSHSLTLVTRIEELKSSYENSLLQNDKEKQSKLNTVLQLKSQSPFIRFNVSSLTDDDLLFFTSFVLEKLYDIQRKRRNEDSSRLLVHCLFDEAHQYIREHFKEERLQSLHVFEKVAREGRKFGLFMMIISQRPSELSQTVLSQCNNYILHRIRNSVDLEYMRKSIPYVTSNQLTRLSYMKSGLAILIGEAFPIPMEVKIDADDDIKGKSSTYLPSDIWITSNH